LHWSRRGRTTLAALRGKVEGSESLADRWGLIAMWCPIRSCSGLSLYLWQPNMKAILDNLAPR
jgi:hypothetical protein